MKIVGISRIRNEAHIISEVLDHVSQLVDEIVILDDCSTDYTVQICESKKKVSQIIRIREWESDPDKRRKLEGAHRQLVYDYAFSRLQPDWIYLFDGDEFADFEGIDFRSDAYKLRLFDYYITKEDKHLSWEDRKWMGPEFRDITMLFRPHHSIRFTSRVPRLPAYYKIQKAGSVKHYGKAISIEDWEKTCQYYINHLNEKGIRRRWQKRIGKAIHSVSDFGNPLIQWDERKSKGIKLIERN